MTSSEIRNLIEWVARSREHLAGQAGDLARALDIARETVERREVAQANMQPTIRWEHRDGDPIICMER